MEKTYLYITFIFSIYYSNVFNSNETKKLPLERSYISPFYFFFEGNKIYLSKDTINDIAKTLSLYHQESLQYSIIITFIAVISVFIMVKIMLYFEQKLSHPENIKRIKNNEKWNDNNYPRTTTLNIILDAINKEQVFTHFVLYGPPGTGKTTMVTKVAHALKQDSPEKNIILIDIKLSECRSSSHGGTEENLQKHLNCIKTYAKNNKVIVCIDEADAVLTHLNDSHNQVVAQGENNLKALFKTFLTEEYPYCENVNVFFTTNKDKNSLDPTMIRPKRSTPILVTFLEKNDRLEIILNFLSKNEFFIKKEEDTEKRLPSLVKFLEIAIMPKISTAILMGILRSLNLLIEGIMEEKEETQQNLINDAIEWLIENSNNCNELIKKSIEIKQLEYIISENKVDKKNEDKAKKDNGKNNSNQYNAIIEKYFKNNIRGKEEEEEEEKEEEKIDRLKTEHKKIKTKFIDHYEKENELSRFFREYIHEKYLSCTSDGYVVEHTSTFDEKNAMIKFLFAKLYFFLKYKKDNFIFLSVCDKPETEESDIYYNKDLEEYYQNEAYCFLRKKHYSDYNIIKKKISSRRITAIDERELDHLELFCNKLEKKLHYKKLHNKVQTIFYEDIVFAMETAMEEE